MTKLAKTSKRASRRCTATTAAGTPCKSWAMPGTDPPVCAAHGGTTRRIGAPVGNQNRTTHGTYSAIVERDPAIQAAAAKTIGDVYEDLAYKQERLSNYIERLLIDEEGRPELRDLVRILALHAQNASRLGRLLRHRRALDGDAADGISGAIARALDEISSEMLPDL